MLNKHLIMLQLMLTTSKNQTKQNGQSYYLPGWHKKTILKCYQPRLQVQFNGTAPTPGYVTTSL